MDAVLEGLYKVIGEQLNQSSLFYIDNNSVIISLCAEYLKTRGYRVIKSPEGNFSNVKKMDDLIHLFYGLLDYKFPSKVGRHRNNQRDRKIAKTFIESRMLSSGCDKEHALKECSLIIETVFSNFSRFNLTVNSMNFGIFGQKNLGWVTEVALGIIRDRELEKEELESDEYCKKTYDWYIKNYGPGSLVFDGLVEGIDGKEKS